MHQKKSAIGVFKNGLGEFVFEMNSLGLEHNVLLRNLFAQADLSTCLVLVIARLQAPLGGLSQFSDRTPMRQQCANEGKNLIEFLWLSDG